MSEENREDEVLARTKSVKEITESQNIIKPLIETKEKILIGVDLEGIHLDQIALVQVKLVDGSIYLFRTGIEPKLWIEGLLKNLFEAPHITKVMHAATADCEALNKQGILVSSLFDTSVIEKVINYQENGDPITTSQSISFKDICEKYGTLSQNHMKTTMKKALWKRANEFAVADPLPRDLTLYSALDVDPLLELYKATMDLIAPDFIPILNNLNETETLRAFDLSLANLRRNKLKVWEDATVLVKDYPKSHTKLNMYQLLIPIEGDKTVSVVERPDSETTNFCFIHCGDKQVAHHVASKLDYCFKSVSLGSPLAPEEIKLSEEETTKFFDQLKTKGYILDPKKIGNMVDKMLSRKGSAYFIHLYCEKGQALMEIHTKTSSKLKLIVTKETVNEGKLKSFFEESSVTKVIRTIGSASTVSAFKILALFKVSPDGLFDLSFACKLMDFWYYGVSVYATTKLNENGFITSILNLEEKDPLRFIKAYHILNTLLPKNCLDLGKTYIQLHLDSIKGVPKAKYDIKTLKQQLCCAVHVYGKWKGKMNQDQAVSMMEEFCTLTGQAFNKIIALDSDVILASMKNVHASTRLIQTILKETQHPWMNRRQCYVKTVSNQEPAPSMREKINTLEALQSASIKINEDVSCLEALLKEL